MNKKYLKDFLMLGVIVIGCAIVARFMARGETLEEYAKNNPEAAGIASTIEMEAITDSSDSSSESSTEILITEAVDSSLKASSEDKAKESAEDIPKEDYAAMEASNSDRTIYAEGFYYEPISNDIFKRISGISYPVDCSISLEELRYVVLLYNDFNSETQSGELICNKAIAQDVVEIFYELYTSGYQIESIKLIDEFDGDDTASMLANNTSCFNYRVVEGTTRLSNHAKGLAIDLNPFYNPYITYDSDGSIRISPEGSETYADRSSSFPYKIDENDLAYQLFKAHGFTWGGNWNSVKDYQHFEKKG